MLSNFATAIACKLYILCVPPYAGMRGLALFHVMYCNENSFYGRRHCFFVRRGRNLWTESGAQFQSVHYSFAKALDFIICQRSCILYMYIYQLCLLHLQVCLLQLYNGFYFLLLSNQQVFLKPRAEAFKVTRDYLSPIACFLNCVSW